MTLAICVRCGAEKFGAFVPCGECGYEPKEPEDLARSIMLTDHTMSPEGLRAVSASIRSGNQPKFDEARVQEIAIEIRNNPDMMKLPAGCTIAMWAPAIILVVLAVVVACVFVYLVSYAP